MLQDDDYEVDRIFEDLEKSFVASQRKRKTVDILAFVGIPAGLILILAGLSLHLLVSILGYAIMLISVLYLLSRFKDFIAFHVEKLEFRSKFLRSR